MSKVKYVLTTYSASMFGTASIHQREIPVAEAKSLIGDDTIIIATRQSHENMAKRMFGDNLRVDRYADMAPESSAVLIHYRGAPVNDAGDVPAESTVTIYLIESEEYLDVLEE